MVKMFVSRQDAMVRKAICNMCPAKLGLLCSECNCLIAAKVRVNYTKCPKDLWAAAEAVLEQPWDVEEILANIPNEVK